MAGPVTAVATEWCWGVLFWQQLVSIQPSHVESVSQLSYAVAALVHAKGYTVLQRVNDQVNEGMVLVTSANFTQAGSFNERNVELGCSSRLNRERLRLFDPERHGGEFPTADIEQRANKVFESEVAAYWLHTPTPNPMLDDQTPLKTADTLTGGERV